MNERKIPAGDLSGRDSRLKIIVYPGSLGDQQQSGSLAIKAMDYPPTILFTNTADLRPAGENPGRESSLVSACSRMYHDTGRFVDHRHPLVFISNGERHSGVGLESLGRRRCWKADNDPGIQPLAARD